MARLSRSRARSTFLYREWNNKSVGYGGNGGARFVEILRQVVTNDEFVDVRAQVGLSLLEPMVSGMLDRVIAWGGAFNPLRAATSD